MVGLYSSRDGFSLLATNPSVDYIPVKFPLPIAVAFGVRGAFYPNGKPKTIIISQRDTPTLEFQLRDSNGELVNLSLFDEILYKITKVGSPEYLYIHPVLLTHTGLDGRCEIELSPIDTGEIGDYIGELELHQQNRINTAARIEMTIVEDSIAPVITP